MFELVTICAGAGLQSIKVDTLREALRLRYVYLAMGVSARIWRTEC